MAQDKSTYPADDNDLASTPGGNMPAAPAGSSGPNYSSGDYGGPVDPNNSQKGDSAMSEGSAKEPFKTRVVDPNDTSGDSQPAAPTGAPAGHKEPTSPVDTNDAPGAYDTLS